MLLVERPVYLSEQPWKVSQLKGRSLLCSHPAWQGELKGSSLRLSLACSQTACNGKDVQETACAHSFLCSLITGSWKKHIQCYSHGQGWCLLGHSALFGFPGVLEPATAQAFTLFGACTELLQVWLRGPNVSIIHMEAWWYHLKPTKIHGHTPIQLFENE